MPVSRSCPRCGAPSRIDNSYCARCGASLPPQPSKKKKVILIIVGVLALATVWSVAIITARRQDRQTAFTTPTPVPSAPAAPTPPQTASDKLAEGNRLIKFEASDKVKEGIEHLRQIPKDAPEYKDAQKLLPQADKWLRDRLAAEKKKAQEAAKEQAELALIGPKPESSAWDGSVRCVDKYLKQVLNDYGSAEYVEWSPVAKVNYKGEPYWGVRLRLRATNAFGGKILKDTYYLIRHNQVVHSEGLGAN